MTALPRLMIQAVPVSAASEADAQAGRRIPAGCNDRISQQG